MNISTFIENIPSLTGICFESVDLSSDQIKEFEHRNPEPANWAYGFVLNRFIFEKEIN